MDNIKFNYSKNQFVISKNNCERFLIGEENKSSEIISHIEKKYGVFIKEIKEKDETCYLISMPGRQRKRDGRMFIIGKYSYEHMMRNFARHLNQGRLNKKNVDETIDEMKSLQKFCQ